MEERMIYMSISRYMWEKGIKQTYLADNTTLSKQAISGILNGNRRLTVDEYVEICDALNVSVDYFLQSQVMAEEIA